jgi:hypothetical protein
VVVYLPSGTKKRRPRGNAAVFGSPAWAAMRFMKDKSPFVGANAFCVLQAITHLWYLSGGHVCRSYTTHPVPPAGARPFREAAQPLGRALPFLRGIPRRLAAPARILPVFALI